jgi:hypothetical protein
MIKLFEAPSLSTFIVYAFRAMYARRASMAMRHPANRAVRRNTKSAWVILNNR